MNKLNLGIIGTGWPGQMHAEAICATRLANVYACADVDEERRGFFKKSYAPEKAYADYHDKGLEIVGVSYDDDPAVLAAFLRRNPDLP